MSRQPNRPHEVIFGLPGTGKTTELLDRLEREITNNEVPLGEITVSTYRKNMAYEFKDRARDIAGKLPENNHFGTTHSICYRLLDIEKDQVCNNWKKEDFIKIEFSLGPLPYNPTQTNQSGIYEKQNGGSELGNILFRMRNYLINTLVEPKSAFKKAIKDLNLIHDIHNFNQEGFRRFNNEYESWKEKEGLYDFNDMILECIRRRLSPSHEVLIEDEFQDKSPLQVELYKQWSRVADRTYIAGDKFQAIYTYMGARPNYFDKEKERSKKTTILDRSYRFGPELWREATRVLKKAGYDIPEITPSLDKDTTVRTLSYHEFEELIPHLQSKSCFFLSRANYLNKKIGEDLSQKGIIFKSNTSSNWSRKQVCVYNALIKIREKIRELKEKEKSLLTTNPDFKLSFDQIRYLIDIYPSKCFSKSKKELREKFKEEDPEDIEEKEDLDLSISPYLTTEFYKSVSSNYPIQKFINSAFSEDVTNKISQTWNKRGEKLIESPEDREITTIHGSKGKERTNVFLFNGTTEKAEDNNLKDEARVWFVGMTRAIENLYIVNLPRVRSTDILNQLKVKGGGGSGT